MKILIIGSEGFIGSNAKRYFREKGEEVFCADIVLKQEENYMPINAEFPDFSRLFSTQKYDVCINATGAANVQFSFQHAALDFSLNTANVYYMLEAIRLHNPECKFINFSSAAVYGNPVYLPIDENHPIKPLSPYGWHKFYSEQICKEFYEYFNVPTISLRVFSAYGPGLKKQLFWDLYLKTLKENPIQIYGTGNESRDFIYIDDLLFAVECVIKNATFDGSAVNVANGEESFIKDVVHIFMKIINCNKEYYFNQTEKAGDPKNWKADITNLSRMGYSNRLSLQNGLKEYFSWVQKYV